ncbi:MAG: hypothetical protein JRI23_30795 [Deltaproteobacteria bacterium]|jgi:hypothetical protein|nr:hypothetical protein [Deltaproteobacteria bacterium]
MGGSGAWTVAGAGLAVVLAGACSARSSLSEGRSGAGGATSADLCQSRIGTVSCRAEPPECGPGQFPASDGTCWTGQCLDCVDGCESSADCVVVRACGCSYHEGCSFAETRYRAERLDSCVRFDDRPCTADCSEAICGSFDCPWCDADAAACEAGRCVSVVDHVCY